ncbi:MAG TPA: hypothetical protein VK203_10100 [Nostocaceae cyanobacterium]|nr:hypothetical protein [Nostocaceae cyanobacterium]
MDMIKVRCGLWGMEGSCFCLSIAYDTPVYPTPYQTIPTKLQAIARNSLKNNTIVLHFPHISYTNHYQKNFPKFRVNNF